MTTLLENHVAATWSVLHPFSTEDQAAMLAMRIIVEPNKGKLQGTAARAPYDAIMERVAAPADVAYEADHVGGVPGWLVPPCKCPTWPGCHTSSRRVVQLGLCQRLSPSGRPYRSSGWRGCVRPRLPACTGTSVSSCVRRRSGLLHWSGRARLLEDRRHRRLRWRQPGAWFARASSSKHGRWQQSSGGWTGPLTRDRSYPFRRKLVDARRC
jgi:hypothetical protein